MPGLFNHRQLQTLLCSGCLHGNRQADFKNISVACLQMTFRALLVGLLLGIAFSLITLKLNITAGEPMLSGRSCPGRDAMGSRHHGCLDAMLFSLDAMLFCVELHLLCQKQQKVLLVATSSASVSFSSWQAGLRHCCYPAGVIPGFGLPSCLLGFAMIRGFAAGSAKLGWSMGELMTCQ